MNEVTEEQWKRAEKHFFGAPRIPQYLGKIDAVVRGPVINLAKFESIAMRFNSGERTQELYDDMMSFE